MIISHKHKIVFVHVPRTGGTSVEYALDPFLGDEDLRAFGMKEFEHLKHLSATEIRDQFGSSLWNDYFTFAFVRNPWDWLVSNYFWHLETDSDDEGTKRTKRFMRKCGGFSDYVQVARIQERSDYVLGSNDEPLVDFVGRFENLERDLAQVCRRVGIPEVPLIHHGATSRRHYSHYFDHAARERVRASRYARVFGYEFEDLATPEDEKNANDAVAMTRTLGDLEAIVRQAREGGDWERALATLRQMIEINPIRLGYYYQSVDILRGQGDHERALDLVDGAIAVVEKFLLAEISNYWAYVLKAQVLASAGRHHEASRLVDWLSAKPSAQKWKQQLEQLIREGR